MARPVRPFALYRRAVKGSRKYVYYARIRDPETGRYTRTVSTGRSSRVRAEEWVNQLLRSEADQEKEARNRNDRVTVADLARSFWDYDGDYAASRRARGKTISRGYLKISESYTRNHIIPHWGTTPVIEVTTPAVDRWVLGLHQSGRYAPATTNKILQAFRTLLDGAVLHEIITTNPASSVQPIRETYVRRGVLSDREVRRLLRWPGPWSDHRLYTINLLAFSTGARMGEIRGLQVEDIHRDHIVISHSWEEGFGLKKPKYNSVRAVPIGCRVYDALQKDLEEWAPESIVFFGKNRQTPMSKSHIGNGLIDALVTMRLPESMKADREKRQKLRALYAARNVSFHGWRHKLNTVLRAAGIPDSKIRLLTGHRGSTMTDWYTSYRTSDFSDVQMIQSKLLEG